MAPSVLAAIHDKRPALPQETRDLARYIGQRGTLVASRLAFRRVIEPDGDPTPPDALRRLIESALAPHLLRGDLCLRGGELSFLLCFEHADLPRARLRAAEMVLAVRREIGRQLRVARVTLSGQTFSFHVGPELAPHEEAIIRELERRFDAATDPAAARAAAQTALSQAQLVVEPMQDLDGAQVPIAFVRLDAASAAEISVALASLEDVEPECWQLDALHLQLAREAVLADLTDGVSRVYLVPVDFAVFQSAERLDELLAIARGIPLQLRSRLILMLRHMPAGTSRLRRQRAFDQLQPFAKGVGIVLDDIQPERVDFGKSRVPLIACPADALCNAWRRGDPQLHLLLELRRRHRARLIATAAGPEPSRGPLAEMGVDLVEPFGVSSLTTLTPTTEAEAPAGALAFRHAGAGLLMIASTPHGQQITDANQSFADMTGYRIEELRGCHWSLLAGPQTQAAALTAIRAAIMDGGSIERDVLVYRKDKTSFWGALSFRPMQDEFGEVNGYILSLSDISSHFQSAVQHHALETLFATVANAIPGYIFQMLVKDGEVTYPYVSSSFARLVGVGETSNVGARLLKQHIHPDDAPRVVQELLRADCDVGEHTAEFRLVRADEKIIWVRAQARPRTVGPHQTIWTGVALDISQEKSVEQNLTHLHQHDILTGLLNGEAFRALIRDRIASTGDAESECAVLDIDLVSFDEINDVFGRPVGDRILQDVAFRLGALAGKNGCAARLSGDSFGMVVWGFRAPAEVALLTNSVVQELSRPFAVDGQHLKIQPVAGAAVLAQLDPGRTSDPEALAEELIKSAGVARHEARLSRSNRFAIYAPEIDNRVRKRARLRQSLHRAIDAEEFELYYQPIVHLSSGSICGAEALIRWNEPTLGIQRPDEFIPLAEESGLIVPLGAWALKSAVRELKRWDEPGITGPRIAVNVSGVQLQERDFVSTVHRIITEGEAEPRQIELELTESFLIHESGRLKETLRDLRDLGVTITIDDFGTGYSSFQYLRELPATKVKIDQSFIRNLKVGSSDASIVRAMIAMAFNLGLDVVVEGVETPEQRSFLIGEGCELAQGYLFSIPLRAEDFFWTFESRAALPLELAPLSPALVSASRH